MSDSGLEPDLVDSTVQELYCSGSFHDYSEEGFGDLMLSPLELSWPLAEGPGEDAWGGARNAGTQGFSDHRTTMEDVFSAQISFKYPLPIMCLVSFPLTGAQYFTYEFGCFLGPKIKGQGFFLTKQPLRTLGGTWELVKRNRGIICKWCQMLRLSISPWLGWTPFLYRCNNGGQKL